jgi:hypothetical protein
LPCALIFLYVNIITFLFTIISLKIKATCIIFLYLYLTFNLLGLDVQSTINHNTFTKTKALVPRKKKAHHKNIIYLVHLVMHFMRNRFSQHMVQSTTHYTTNRLLLRLFFSVSSGCTTAVIGSAAKFYSYFVKNRCKLFTAVLI